MLIVILQKRVNVKFVLVLEMNDWCISFVLLVLYYYRAKNNKKLRRLTRWVSLHIGIWSEYCFYFDWQAVVTLLADCYLCAFVPILETHEKVNIWLALGRDFVIVQYEHSDQ